MYDSKVKTNDDVAQKSQVEGRIDRNILDDSRLLFYLKITSELYYPLLAAILDSKCYFLPLHTTNAKDTNM